MFHMNRGPLHYSLDDLKGDNPNTDRLCEEIEDEMLSQEELAEMMKRFRDCDDHYRSILTCGACGCRKPGQLMKGRAKRHMTTGCYTEVSLRNLDELKYSEEEVTELERKKRDWVVTVPISETEDKTLHLHRM